MDEENPEVIPEEQNADDDEPATFWEKVKYCFATHYQGLISMLTLIILLPLILPPPTEKYQWCAYCLCVMAVYWVSECIPLPVTSFLPIIIFPLTGVLDCITTCKCYINDTVVVFVGSLIMAVAVEQSGLHIRLALTVIRAIGYSHYKLLFAMMSVTMFVSMWVTNTAATTMMVPINFALLKVFEDQGLLKIYDETPDGKVASDITTCYFCAATFSATIGGIGTLVGTGTNLAFKGLLESAYPDAPEYLSFPSFSAFAIPYMIAMEICCYLYFIFIYFGFLRPNSKEAKAAVIPPSGVEAAKLTVEKNYKDLGPITLWEMMVILLFSTAILLFFCRSPQIFTGWGDAIAIYYGVEKKFVRDTPLVLAIIILMLLLPQSMKIFKNFTAKVHGDFPTSRTESVLMWEPMAANLSWSFMFLLGGGFALSTAAKKEHTNLNGRIGDILSMLDSLPNCVIVLIVVIFTIFLTNFASNVAVANVVVPIGMTLAAKIKQNPLLYNIACGYSASYCFCLPVGTPGNLVVQGAAHIPTVKMIQAGIGPTITTILVTWAALMLWAPVVWPDLHLSYNELPWAKQSNFI